MAKSGSDFTLILRRGNRKLTILSGKDFAIDPGQKATAQKSNQRVAFMATGAPEPSISGTVVDGDEAGRVGRFCINGRTGKLYTDLTVMLIGRNASSGTIVTTLKEATASEGAGKRKAGEADGFQGDGAVKFGGTSMVESVNGGAEFILA